MLGHGLDETRIARIVAQRPAQSADALGQSLIRYRNPAPDLVHEAILGNEAPPRFDKQDQRIEIAAAQLHRRAIAAHLPVGTVERIFGKAQNGIFLGHAPLFAPSPRR